MDKEPNVMTSLACLNGEMMPVEEAKVPVWDRGFLFGDSVYEVFRLYQGRLWLEAEHIARLARSLREMEFSGFNLDLLIERVKRTVSASRIGSATVYIQVTRGVAPRSHAFPNPPVSPTELIIVRAYDDEPTARLRETGVEIVSLPDLRWGRCDVKSTNLLANVLALELAHRQGAYEAVLVDRDNFVTEATHSSILWVRNGQLQGTPDGPTILPGTKRHFVETLAPQIELPFTPIKITLDELLSAEEVMLLGTTIEVLPVNVIDGQVIGTGAPGPLALRLQKEYRTAVKRWLAEGEV